jgi:hypothetical protein
MNNKTVAKIVAGLTILLFLVCEEAVSGNVPSQEKPWEVSEQTLVSVIGESHYSPSEFVDALGTPSLTLIMESVRPKASSWYRSLIRSRVHSQLPDLDVRFIKECGKGLLSKRCWEIQSYTFTYRSQTVDGREKEMSGRVTFLANKEGTPHQVKSISLHSHQALLNKDWAPSQSLMFAPLKVLWDSAVIEPDFQNWGVNHGIEPDGSGSSIQMGRQLADCTVAALEVMRRHGVTLSPKGYTTNWGSSQGAMPALQFAKWYDTDAPQWFKNTLQLRSTFATEAAVDSPETTKIWYQHPEYISLGIIALVGYFQGFTPEQMGGYRPEDFVTEGFTEKKYPLEDGRTISFLDAVSLSYSQITQPVTETITSFEQVVAPDMLTEDGKVNLDCPKIVTWLSCLKKYNTLEGWTPQHPVYLAHAPKDDMIPYELAYQLYRTVSDEGKNPNVHMLSIPFPSFFPTGGMKSHLIISFLGQVLLSFEENPEDMRLRYKSVK